ncbi:iron complex transport system substrate-binding protein [Aromatoleum tolulyticum]|uniref:Iron complex transport system substrate-binding protein n=1 Tax=Aromatoleum tolulyticum TaxID=34027 RepID=A0A1N6YFD0_9RHOO|nr:cobalamin-binding protein [Aromatoleum tolulyticum]SIR13221.1 iron complex transport system substrate-binding protein [Aromatoleum tolulyticum]
MSRLPRRIVCLSTETVEVLYALGEQDRIVGISGYTVIPPQARKEKPKVFAFSTGDLDRILAVEPDLVLCFCDLQADIARDLVKAGVAVHVFNQRSVEDILAMIETVGRLVGAEPRAQALVGELEQLIDATRTAAARLPRRPRVYFEEWDEPAISGIRWVSELIGIAGGEDIFAELASRPSAKDRRLADPLEAARRQPDIVIGSWCGKRFRPEKVAARAGWQDVPAVRNGQLHEIKSAIILAPGPVAIREGLPALAHLFADWARSASE